MVKILDSALVCSACAGVTVVSSSICACALSRIVPFFSFVGVDTDGRNSMLEGTYSWCEVKQTIL